MRAIYANASQVVVWLGEQVESDKHAMDFLRWLSAFFHQKSIDIERESDKLITGNEWALVRLQKPEKFRHLAALLRREWFNRTWAVQEVASA